MNIINDIKIAAINLHAIDTFINILNGQLLL